VPQTTLVSSKDPKVTQCIEDCIDCGNSCLETMSHCLHMGGRHADPAHITLLANCAEICRTSADFMLSGSGFSSEVCNVCAPICDACATSCEEFADDELMAACAELCRSCVDSCREMAKM
jgi:hypothetical protein